MALLCFWEGFPFSVLGFDMILGYQIFAALMFVGAVIYFVQVFQRRQRLGFWEITTVAFFAWCFIVSFRFSVFVEPQPLAGWLLAVFTASPLLAIFTFKLIKATRDDALNAIYAIALVGTALVIIDRVLGTGLLELYERGSAFTDGKTVIFKYPATFGVVIAAMRCLHAPRPKDFYLNLVGLALLSYNVIIFTESRLVMAALALAAIPIYLLCVPRNAKVPLAFALAVIAVPLASFAVSRYLSGFESYESYMSSDVSASFRQIEMDLFQQEFDRTSGMGFGFMSGNPAYDNVLTYMHYSAGQYVGTGDYGAGLVDVGIYAALYQYGYIGVAFTIFMTLATAFALIRGTGLGPRYTESVACGVLTITFLISPIPTNFFTLFATAHMGALIWFLASEMPRQGIGHGRRQPLRRPSVPGDLRPGATARAMRRAGDRPSPDA